MSEGDTLPLPPGYDRGLIAGKYRLTRQIGRGGMGTVWEGVHETLGTRVAVKLIESDHVQTPESLRRFENEARAAARLQSKHVVEVYDQGVTPDGRAFIVMQYLQGEPLDQRLARLGRLSPEETARIVLQVCRALSKAHSVRIVHRDLKPENIFLVWDEEDGADIVKVVDFGIAKFIDPTNEAAGTHTGSLLGTPFYMSPEQARGLRTVDHRSDLWSVGVIAFRCLSGRLPFQGESIGDVIVELCTGPIPVPSETVPDMPPGLDEWMARALSRDIAARFSSAAELADALAQVCGIPTRPAYSTGDVPIRRSDSDTLLSDPVITPSYSKEQVAADPTLASRLVARRTGAEVSIGGGLTNTPALTARRSRTSIVTMVIVALVVLGGSVAAIIGSRSTMATGTTDVPHGQPLPSVAVPPEPVARVASSALATASAVASVPVPTVTPPAASSTPSAPRRVQAKVPKRSPGAASSSRTAPNLDIRLQR